MTPFGALRTPQNGRMGGAGEFNHNLRALAITYTLARRLHHIR